MVEFEIDGKSYKGGQLDAFKQFHVVKRLAPLFGALSAGGEGGLKISTFLSAIGSIPDADVDFVLKTALGVTHRKQGETVWARVANDQGKLMFDDIGLLEMSEIAYHVLNDNLASFFSGVARRGWVSPV